MVDTNINKIARYRLTKSGKTGKNAARDFRRYIFRDGKTFPVSISSPEIPLRQKVRTKHGRRKRSIREIVVKYPVILLTNWMKTILQKSPRFLLGGHDIGGSAYMDMLEEFWDNFRLVDDSHPIYQKDPSRRKRTIPIALHGDEGRGLSRAPVLILSYQVLIPFTGVESLNASVQLALNSFVVDCVIYLLHGYCQMAMNRVSTVCVCVRHSFSTRLLYTVLPSQWYAKDDASIDGLHQALADDFCAAFEDGVSVDALCLQ